MLLRTSGFRTTYELESLSRMLFPEIRLRADETKCDGDGVTVELVRTEGDILLNASVTLNGRTEQRSRPVAPSCPEKDCVLQAAALLYEAARAMTGTELRWGVLTGIRPIKLFHNALDEGKSEAEIKALMRERYAVGEEMASLALLVATAERKIHKKNLEKGFSLYISIPFCPSRCSYCSFVSQSIEREGHLMAPYVDRLCREIALTGKLAAELGLQLQTVYVGGGTPTTLTPNQLSGVLLAVQNAFDLSNLLEFTVEAGRPDTIDPQKLAVLQKAGVTRISVNPQSMDDEILEIAHRMHRAADVCDTYKMVREMGAWSINMDVIAGLSGDTPQRFKSSLQRVIELAPENITVHTLTLKRTSFIAGQKELYEQRDAVGQMIDDSRIALQENGYFPYYLYRQKNSVGNLDNTGYAKPGHEGIYNVFMMDETQTVLATGANAVTKLRGPDKRIERIFNLKLPREYIDQYPVIEKRKERVRQFYEGYQSKQELEDRRR